MLSVSLALSYAKRIALLSCHSYAALAVSFAATCREHIQVRRALRLAALCATGCATARPWRTARGRRRGSLAAAAAAR